MMMIFFAPFFVAFFQLRLNFNIIMWFDNSTQLDTRQQVHANVEKCKKKKNQLSANTEWIYIE
jgi:BioD-like phosphotransacetylase family protein